MENVGDVQSIDSLSDVSELRSASSTALNEETCVVASGECRPGPRLDGRPAARKEDQQARYWSYLFDNLHRVVDEIYCTCEADQSVIECEEMMMTLDVCKKDFETLSRKIEVEQEHDGTQNKSAAVSWEIRFTPSRSRSLSARLSETETQSSTAAGHVRHLHFPVSAPAPGVSSSRASDSEREERDPTPIAALFTQQGFELASTVSLSQVDKPAVPLPIGHHASEPSQPACNESGPVSVPVVRKSHGGKVQVYVGIPADAPPSLFSREPQRELPSGQMLEEIEAQNPPEEGWEVVQPRNWRLSEKKKRSQEDSCSQHSAARTDNGAGSMGSRTSHDAEQPLVEGVDGVSSQTSVNERGGEAAAKPVMNFSKAVTGGAQGPPYSDAAKGLLDPSSTHLNSDDVLNVPQSPGGVGKSPSRRMQLQQKLSSPQRRWELDSEKSRQLLDEKLAKAQVQRDKLKEERSQRLRDISHKIQGVRQLRDCEIEKRRVLMIEKLERAKTLRDTHIQEIIRKAQAEDVKKNEIAFINSLEAQNKRIEVLERHLGDEARLHDLQEGRQRKREEQQAKEEAALERRRTIEADRLARVQEMHLRRQEQDLKREQRRSEMERAREEAAKEKAKERERKLVAHMTALQSSAEELERKIQLKHDESAKRYDLQLEQIREKAALVSRHTSAEDSLKVTPYERMKWCSVCQVKIVSELYLMAHLRSKQHLEATASLTKQDADLSVLIMELPDEVDETSHSMYDEVVEKLKGNKKRLKKLRARMATRVKALDVGPPSKADLSKLPPDQKARLQKLVRELNKHVDACGESPWPSSQLAPLDRTLGEVVRCLSGRSQKEQVAFAGLQGIATVARALAQLAPSQENGKKATCSVPLKSVSLMANVIKATCQGCHSNCVTFVTANQIQPVADVLIHLYLVHIKELSRPSAAEGERREMSREEELRAFSALLSALAVVYSTLATTQSLEWDTAKATLDSISYVVAVGVFDCMLASFRTVCGPMEDYHLAELLVSSLNLLIAVSAYLHVGVKDVFAVKRAEDTTQFLEVMQRTELFGVPSLLYAILLHAGAPRHSHSPPTLPEHTIAMATAAMKLMNNVALINLHSFQLCLGDDSISLQFRGITSYLIWHCKHLKNEILLQELITAVGYFCVLNVQNQALLRSGHSPTLIQLLCTLPFEYFSSPRLVELLFPTLIAACYKNRDNRSILEQEISCELLVAFIRGQLAKKTHQKPESCSDSPAVDTIHFQNRFPPDQWEDALAFFTASSEQGQ